MAHKLGCIDALAMTHHFLRLHRRNSLPLWQRTTLYLSAFVLLATGVAWLAAHYLAGAGADGLPHPLEAWTTRLHGLAAFLGLFILGAMAGAHIPQGWRLSGRHRWAQQRASGVALCGCAGLLALTGYLLYYFAPENVRPPLGWIHSGIGFAMAVLVLVHKQPKSRQPRD
jgi:hypothetical protein